MDVVLREHLPLELVEIIMKMVHKMNMRDIHYMLKNNLVWIYADNQFSYIISENINYYTPLLYNVYGSYSPLTRKQLREAKKNKIKALKW
jgi:hypothetical protein